ncbi:unnamed protein product [Nesidiocoris tenuis]|uniref:Uncharacterized protein n=1 Tax=Nesidiocoris tenuis TaxID=355587 RepID=A0A6H5GTH4_9HEMI|nr:unnamed protein product [Nesidiocoris tenuis]
MEGKCLINTEGSQLTEPFVGKLAVRCPLFRSKHRRRNACHRRTWREKQGSSWRGSVCGKRLPANPIKDNGRSSSTSG